MDLGDALQELGMARGASADEIRRAYVRLLKVHRPEADATRFMRLREAYEIARVYARHAGSAALAEASPERGQAAPEVVVLEQPTPSLQAPSPITPPTSPPPPEAPRPDHTDTAPATPTLSEDDGALVGPRVERLVGENRVAEAASELSAWLERHREAVPNPAATIALILRCLAKGDANAASRLASTFATALRAYGLEARMSPTLAITWAVARELCALGSPDRPGGKTIDTRVIDAIARAALVGDLALAAGELKDLRSIAPRAATDAARALREGAPTLATTYAAILDPPSIVARVRRKRTWSWKYTAPVIVLIQFLRFLTSSTTSDMADTRTTGSLNAPIRVQAKETPAWAQEVLSPDNGLKIRSRQFADAFHAADRLHDIAQACKNQALAEAAQEMRDRLRNGECSGMDDLLLVPRKQGCSEEPILDLTKAFDIACPRTAGSPR